MAGLELSDCEADRDSGRNNTGGMRIGTGK